MSFQDIPEITAKFAGQPYDLNTVMTPDQVWAYLDSAPEEVRQSLITLVNSLNSTADGSSGGDNLGMTPLSTTSGNTAQSIIEWLNQQIIATALGQIPDNSLTELKMGLDMKKGIAGGVESFDSAAEHKADSAYQVAGGTATAITLTIHETLSDGFPMTFIASANNSGGATTINTKSLYKPNTTTAPNLIAGKAYTVWWSVSGDCFFIKASAEGNTIAGHVLAGDTFSNDSDTGLVGTMDLSQLMTSNIKKGISINGITGILPFLPSQYTGKRLATTDTLDNTNYPNYPCSATYTLDETKLIYAAYNGTKTVYLYDVNSKLLTNLGQGGINGVSAVCCSDDGSVIYAVDSATGVVWCYQNGVWTSTSQIAYYTVPSTKSIACNSDGSELYYYGIDSSVNRWIKVTNTKTVLTTNTSFTDGLTWTDDNCLWYATTGSSSYGALIKIRLSDGVAIKTINFTSANPLRFGRMYRSSSGLILGTACTNSGTSNYITKVNLDGTITQAVYIATGNYVTDRTGVFQAGNLTSSFSVYSVENSNSPIYTNSTSSATPSALTKDGNLCVWNTYIYSNYPYQ